MSPPKSRSQLKSCIFYAWLRVSGSRKAISIADTKKLQKNLRSIVSARLHAIGIPYAGIVATTRTGSAAELISDWLWHTPWGPEHREMQPVMRALRMIQDQEA